MVNTFAVSARKILCSVGLIASLAVLPAPAQAAPIVGELQFTGSVIVTSAGIIDWVLPVGGGFGEFRVGPGTSGYFTPLIGQTGREADLNQAVNPVGVQFSLPNFETFPNTSLSGLTFELNYIFPCYACGILPPTSPFNLLFNPNSGNTTIEISMRGLVRDTANPGEVSTWLGTWSADFVGQTPLQVITELETTGSIRSDYSAAKVTTAAIPEPATLLTFGTGTVILGAIRRRRAKKARQA